MRRKRIVTIATAGVVVGGLSLLEVAGCNLIVDSGGYQVVAEDATTGGNQDSGGINGADTSLPPSDSGNGADTNQPPTDSGNPPGTDSGQQADGGEDSGSCGSTLQTTSAAFQQILLACVLDQGCLNSAEGDSNSDSVGSCVAFNELPSISAVTNCESKATTCTGITSCTGEGWLGPCSTGTSDTPSSICDAQNRINYCAGSGDGWFWDCSHNGGTCENYIDKSNPGGGVVAACVVASCSSPTTDGGEYCSGNNLYTCVGKADGGDIGTGQDCGDFFATCEPGSNGTSCYYTLPACNAATTAACNGNVGQVCYPTGLQTFNCGAAGLTCSPTADTFTGLPFSCVAPGCDPTQCQETCNGTVATFCVGGAPVNFDCSTQNMQCVDTGNTDDNGNDLMACQPS